MREQVDLKGLNIYIKLTKLFLSYCIPLSMREQVDLKGLNIYIKLRVMVYCIVKSQSELVVSIFTFLNQ